MNQSLSTFRERSAVNLDERPKYAALSAILIIGFPTLFWMLMLEGAVALFGISISPMVRMIAFTTITAFLALVWSCMRHAD